MRVLILHKGADFERTELSSGEGSLYSKRDAGFLFYLIGTGNGKNGVLDMSVDLP